MGWVPQALRRAYSKKRSPHDQVEDLEAHVEISVFEFRIQSLDGCLYGRRDSPQTILQQFFGQLSHEVLDSAVVVDFLYVIHLFECELCGCLCSGIDSPWIPRDGAGVEWGPCDGTLEEEFYSQPPPLGEESVGGGRVFIV